MRKRQEQATLTVEFATVGKVSLRQLRVTGPPEYLGGVLHALLYLGVEPTEEPETDEDDETKEKVT